MKHSVFIRGRQRSIKVEASGSILIFSTVVMLMFFILQSYLVRAQIFTFNRQLIDSSLTAAMLGAEVIKLNEFADTGDVIFVDNTKDIFSDILKYNLGTDSNFRLTREGITDNIIIEEYIVYNKIKTSTGYYIQEIRDNNNGKHTINHSEGEVIKVATTDGEKIITEASLYARISFVINVGGYREGGDNSKSSMYKRLALSRLTSVKTK